MYHLHVTFAESESRKRVIAFRDYLIKHSEDLKQYAQIKQKAAIEANEHRDTYLAIKQSVINELIKKAYTELKI